MTISKVLNILRYIDHCIKSEKSIKAAEIAEKLKISERQVFNYLKAMKTEGFPIAYCRKTHKFYYTEEGFCFLGLLFLPWISSFPTFKMMKRKYYKITTQELNHPSLQPSLRGLTLAFGSNGKSSINQ